MNGSQESLMFDVAPIVNPTILTGHKKCARRWYLKNRQTVIDSALKWNREHSDAHRMATNKWRKKNPDLVKLQNKRADTKDYSTPKGKLNCCMSAGIYASLAGIKNGRKWTTLVGYTVDILKKYLEGLFRDGMSWDNYGEWHVDHKIPLTAFNFENVEDLDFKKAWSLKNLQPMWALENMKKGTKISKSFQPSLLIRV